ncbi:uncharacterized protein LOC111703880 [Eurytemora carolleeae]|uniref:uncharacterized protein LOC111703880 n=1 Tax=Eurytemora carolleeae TaxID=1294199 RepID=UPI000C77E528|nr:uncharacterized protein LOC111703880 [Eurytemora carolleeae]|eukprot:XP_023331730.1 uncharacterized protein LOC111703880 [Eurytemora affinis]
MAEDAGFEGNLMLQSLIDEINTAEEELNNLRAELKNTVYVEGEESILSQARFLQEETRILKSAPPDGFVEDKGVQYYLALGILEKQIKELRSITSISESHITSNQQILKELDLVIAEQEKLVSKMENVVAERTKEALTDAGKAAARRKAENELRATKMIYRDFKTFFREYLNKVGSLDPSIEGDDVPVGYLLQTLWSTFQEEDREGWINIQELSYDVRKEDVQKLLLSGIIQEKEDTNFIQLVDFTMRF